MTCTMDLSVPTKVCSSPPQPQGGSHGGVTPPPAASMQSPMRACAPSLPAIHAAGKAARPGCKLNLAGGESLSLHDVHEAWVATGAPTSDVGWRKAAGMVSLALAALPASGSGSTPRAKPARQPGWVELRDVYQNHLAGFNEWMGAKVSS